MAEDPNTFAPGWPGIPARWTSSAKSGSLNSRQNSKASHGADGPHSSRTAHQAYQSLYIGFIVAPFLAGLDKFTHVLTDWDQYLAPAVARLLPVSGHTFMLCVGIAEMTVAVLVAVRPRIGAYVLAGWLFGIIANLLLIPGHFDVALRDFGLALGALALARLSEASAHPTARGANDPRYTAIGVRAPTVSVDQAHRLSMSRAATR